MEDTYYTSTPAVSGEAEAAAALITLVVYFLVFVFVAIPMMIATWKLFTKAGKPGWAAIVPIYNQIVMAEIGKINIAWGIAAVFVPFVGFYVLYKFITAYDGGVGFWLLYLFFPIIAIFLVKNVNYTGGNAVGQFGPQPAMGPQPQYGQPYAQPAQPMQPSQPAQYPPQQMGQPQPSPVTPPAPQSYQPAGAPPQGNVTQPPNDTPPAPQPPTGYPQA